MDGIARGVRDDALDKLRWALQAKYVSAACCIQVSSHGVSCSRSRYTVEYHLSGFHIFGFTYSTKALLGCTQKTRAHEMEANPGEFHTHASIDAPDCWTEQPCATTETPTAPLRPETLLYPFDFAPVQS